MEVHPRPPFLALIAKPFLRPAPQPDDSIPLREGEILLSKGDTEKALWRFKRLITEFPKSPLFNEAKFRMGICYTQLKRPQGCHSHSQRTSAHLSCSDPEWSRSSLCWEITTSN